MSEFVLSRNLDFNSSGWGPSSDSVPEKYKNLPFSSFDREEKIGKAADFGSLLVSRNRMNIRRSEMNTDLAEGLFSEASNDFTVVDESRLPKKFVPYTKRIQSKNPMGARGWEDKRTEKAEGSSFNKRYNKLNQARWVDRNSNRRSRDPSVREGPDWMALNTIDIAQLKTPLGKDPVVADIVTLGRLGIYEDGFDGIGPRKPVKLSKNTINVEAPNYPLSTEPNVVNHLNLDTLTDSTLADLFAEGEGDVFVADNVLAHLMMSNRGIYPWDLVINYVNGKILISTRNEKTSMVSSVTVNENSQNPPKEDDDTDINSAARLTLEATTSLQNFIQQATRDPSGNETSAVPIASHLEDVKITGEDNAELDLSKYKVSRELYRYRTFTLDDNTKVIVRTTVHAATREGKLINFLTFNEYDPSISETAEYKRAIETTAGHLFVSELKNNAFMVAKQTTMALLAGVDNLKIGYIGRVNKADPNNHQVYSVKSIKPDVLATQISISTKIMWGVLKYIIDLVRKNAQELQMAEEDVANEEYQAKFVLLKDPNSNKITLFSVPLNSFEGEENFNEDEDEQDNEDDEE